MNFNSNSNPNINQSFDRNSDSNRDSDHNSDPNSNPNPDICLFCNADKNEAYVSNNPNKVCPFCFDKEPTKIDGFTRSRHPLYPRWNQLKERLIEKDKTFSNFYLFTLWFKKYSTNFQSVIVRCDQAQGFTEKNCYVDTTTRYKGRHSMFSTLTEAEYQVLEKSLLGGSTTLEIAKKFGISFPTAKRLIADYQKHTRMSKYL